jgi:hypothetical protein
MQTTALGENEFAMFVRRFFCFGSSGWIREARHRHMLSLEDTSAAIDSSRNTTADRPPQIILLPATG